MVERNMTIGARRNVPRLGLGTWRMGERAAGRAGEVAALRQGLDLGMRLIDTAEMYGEGGAEIVVGEAIAGRRDEVYLVSKVYPHNASRGGTVAACERSLERLGTDRIDLYLLHWPGSHPLADTVAAFETLKRDGKIGDWGVSNFDDAAMGRLAKVPDGNACASNQVMYHLGERGIEWALLSAMKSAGFAVMAYSPLGDGSILTQPALQPMAKKHGVTPAAIALAFVLRHRHVVAIPKAARPEHLRQNVKALEVRLDADDVAALDRAFPPPRKSTPLAVS